MWTGGLAVLGFVRRGKFSQPSKPAEPIKRRRVLAGSGLRRRLRAVSSTGAWILGAILIGLFIARALLGPRLAKLGLRLLVVAVMISLGAATAYAITPRIDTIRTETRGSNLELARLGLPPRRNLGRLHALSRVFMLITLAGGVGLLWRNSMTLTDTASLKTTSSRPSSPPRVRWKR
jgi:hypothetical protein